MHAKPLVLLGALVVCGLLGGCRLAAPHAGSTCETCEPCAPTAPVVEVPTGAWGCCEKPRRLGRRWAVELEAGPTWLSRNDASVPNIGTRFSLTDLTGSGPFAWGRVSFDYRIARRHSVRAFIAPFSVTETGTLNQPVSFQGRVFATGVPTQATYKFNSYRLTYRYLLCQTRRWSFHVGATAKIRDAKIELVQGGVASTESDVGFVPLLHLDAEYRFAPCWRLTADLDGLAAPGGQGRAFDFALKLHRDIDARWSVGLGYRTLEGGADVTSAYNFAWLHQALVSATYRF